MATTDIQPFGSGGTGASNVLTQSAYLTFLASLAGNSFATGAIPTAQQWNKILRQASFMAAGLANWLVNRGITVLDDGNMAALVAEIQAGMSAYLIKSVAGSSDVTLNPTTEANYNIISLTGALTGNINVIVPSRPGSWIFANGTSGAYTITIKCAASATSVIIPQSATLQVWCDGSYVFATTVVQNANLTGAIISVGNATSLGSFSSAALAAALTDETGSGSIVFNNSPSLLGAPTAPTAATGTNTTQLATTAYAYANDIGWGQTWQNVTSSRAGNTAYTNNTGKPIQVIITWPDTGGTAYASFNIGGVAPGITGGLDVIPQVAYDIGSGSATFCAQVIVPNGSTYGTHNGGYTSWTELR